MKTRLFATTAVAGFAFFMASPAFAACTQSGAAYTCTGTEATDIPLGANSTFDTSGGSATISGIISGAFSAEKINTGTLTLTGANTYSGGTIVSGGTLAVNGDTNLGSASGTVSINAATLQYLGSATSARDMTLTGASTIRTNGFPVTISGTVSGTGNLAKSGAGILTLTGTNTYSGGTTINNGTVVVGADANLGNAAGSISFANNSILQYSTGFSSARNVTLNGSGGTIDTNGNNATLSGVIAGAGPFTKAGAGTLTLSGTNTYSGGTTISAGTLLVSAANLPGNVTNNAILQFNQVSAGSYGGIISGTGALVKTSSGTLILTGANTYTGGTTITSGPIAVSADNNLGGAGDITFGAAGEYRLQASFNSARNMIITGAGTTALLNTNGFNTTLSGVISGAGGIIKHQIGTLTLTGTNTYSGGTTIDNGVLNVSADANLGNASGGLIITGGTLQYGAAFNSARAVTVTNTATIDTNGFTSGLTGVISGTGALVKTGSGTLNLTGTNTYSGGTTVSGGFLSVSSPASLPGDVALSGGSLIFNQSTTGTYAGVVSGNGGIFKYAAGALTLTGVSTYTGGTTLSGGTLIIGADNNLGNASGSLAIGGGATLQFSADMTSARSISLTTGGGQFDTGANAITLSGTIGGANALTKLGTGTLTLSGTNGYSGGTTISAGTLQISADSNLGNASGGINISNGATLRFSSGVTSARDISIGTGGGVISSTGTSTLSGTISGTGRLSKTGGGALILSGANSYVNTTISQGVLEVSADNNLGIASGTITLSGGILKYDAGFTSARSVILTTNATINTNGFDSALTGVISGTGDLIKTGTGTLAISGFNTFTGNIRINGGTLRFDNGSLGNAANTISMDSGTLAFGISTSTSRNITLNAGGGTVDMNGNAVTLTGVISGTGAFTKTGGNILTVSGANTYTGGTTVNGGGLTVSAENNLGDVSGALTLNGGTLLYATGFTSARALVLGASGGTIQVGSSAANITGVISGTGALTKTGSSSLGITGTNTYSGGTIINGGTLQVTNDSNLGNISGALTLNGGNIQYNTTSSSARNVSLGTSGGSITVLGGNTTTISGVVSGTGSLTKFNSGTLVLSGTNTYTGGTTINQGILQIGADTNLGDASGGVTINNNATLLFTSAVTSARAVTLGAGTALINTNGNNSTLSGVISGAGGLTKTGSGTLVLSGANTYTGGTTITAGSITVSADNNLGATSGALTLQSASLLFSTNFTSTRDIVLTGSGILNSSGQNVGVSGVISGTGALTKNGTGTLILTGANTYTGGTTIAAGILIASVAALNNGNVANSGTLNFNQTTDATYSGVLSGTGALTKSGAGILTLSGTNTYSGTTTITDGTLSIGASANLGDASGTNGLAFDGGTLRYTAAFATSRNVALTGNGTINTNGFASTLSGVISGAGALTKTGTGTLTLSGTNTYTGGTSITGGTVIVTADANLGNTAGGITMNAGILQFNADATSARNIALAGNGTIAATTHNITLGGVISGAGKLTKNGSGNVTLTGNNTFSGGFEFNGNITISADNNLGATNGNVVLNSGILNFNAGMTSSRSYALSGSGGTFNTNGNDVTLSGTIFGIRDLTKSGAGTLILTGANTNTGQTIISAGTLQGNTASLHSTSIIDNAALTFNQATDGIYAGVISGTGTFEKTGAGALNLTGDNTYTGTTTISAGTLSVNGDNSASDITLANGATLKGSGTTGSITAQGIIAPGNSIGTMHVNGSVDFQSGSVYQVEFNDAGQSDLIDATGGINITSGSVVSIGASGSYAASTTYTILHGVSVNGTFTGGITTDLAFLTPTLIYNANNVQMLMQRNDVDFSEVAADPQQAQVADAVNDLGVGNPIYNEFTGLSAGQAQAALDDLGGEANAGTATAIAASTGIVENVLTTHMTGLSHTNDIGDTAALSMQDPSVYSSAYLEPAAGTSSSRMWMQAIGTLGRSAMDHGAGTPGQERHSYGAIGGLDIPYEEGFIGIFAGYERGEVTTNAQGASSDLNNYHLGAYGTKSIWEGVTLSGGLGATYHDIETVRHIQVGALEFSPHGNTHAYSTDAFAQVSKPITLNGIALEPFAGINLTYTHMNGYDETNGGAANLTIDGSSTVNPATIIGARFGKSFEDNGHTFNTSASLGWQHTLGDIDGKITERFVGGTTGFSAFGAARDRNAAVIGLGIDATIGTGAKAFAGYDGTISANSQDHGFKAGIKVDF